jgi:hypothetical protein
VLYYFVAEADVYPGMFEGVKTMKKGEEAMFVCTPAYFLKGKPVAPRIPANAWGMCMSLFSMIAVCVCVICG